MPTKLLIGTVFSVLTIAVGRVWFRDKMDRVASGLSAQLVAPLFEPSAGREAHLVWNRRTEKEV